MSTPQDTAAAAAARRNLQRGDFLESAIELATRNMATQLKAEYQRELSKVMEAAGLERVEPWEQDAPEVACAWQEPLPGGPGQLREAATAVQEPMVQADVPGMADTTHGGETVPPPTPVKRKASSDQSPTPAKRNSVSSVPVPTGRNSIGSIDTKPLKTFKRAKSTYDTSGLKIKMDNKFRDNFVLTDKEEETLKRLRAGQEPGDSSEVDARVAYAQSRTATGRFMSFSLAGASESRKFAFNIITKRSFDFVMGLVIIANAVTIGLETSITVHGNDLPTSLLVFEYMFLLIYIVELFLRFHAVGMKKALQSKWVKFDALLVIVGVINFIMNTASVEGQVANLLAGNINMLKLLRLLRLARTVRVLVQFRTLWLLVQGLIHATAPMAWTCLIMCMVIYVFAVIGMEMIVGTTGGGMEGYVEAAANFDSIWESMLTLMQLMFLDSTAAIYRPLVLGSPLLAFYFMIFVLIGPIALMGIVTAILVESSLRTANEDNEAKKAWETIKRKEMVPKLQHLFKALDVNSDGEVDLGELFGSSDDIKEQIQRIIDLDEMAEIFRMLDVDMSGAVTMDEFIEGIIRSQADKPSELIVLVRQGRAILELLQNNSYK